MLFYSISRSLLITLIIYPFIKIITNFETMVRRAVSLKLNCTSSRWRHLFYTTSDQQQSLHCAPCWLQLRICPCYSRPSHCGWLQPELHHPAGSYTPPHSHPVQPVYTNTLDLMWTHHIHWCWWCTLLLSGRTSLLFIPRNTQKSDTD